ncbi:ATP-dependent DNA helicase DDM1 [Tanacetum coccineum]
MVPKNDVIEEPLVDSPTSVLEEEDICNEKVGMKVDEDPIMDAKNGDASLISPVMVEEEVKLEQQRCKEEENEEKEAPTLNDTQFSKLDELLSQTQLYSEFLLEKMDEITNKVVAEDVDEVKEVKKKGRGSKRKAVTSSANTISKLVVLILSITAIFFYQTHAIIALNSQRAKKAVAAMLTRAEESTPSDMNLSKEERSANEQSEICPLLTGGQLKSYQVKGVKWLISLWQNGLNGILADQMGLGKTIQTIGFLAHLKGKGMDGPYLVIAPLSTLANWLNEISRFAPSVNAVIYHGDRNARDEIRRKHMPKSVGPKFPIVITSYEVAMNDAKKHLRHYNWKYLVVDEGHRLKNSKCKLLRELKWLPVENKLLLTGTPLQNNLAELWSLLNFILPDIFSSHEEFESWFDFSGKSNSQEAEEGRKKQVVAKLHAILRPFLLRRMKEDVEHMLPRKKEIILYATLTEHQKNFQDHLVNRTLETYLLEKVDTGRGSKARLNNLMIQLRKNCNHPDLLEAAFEGSCFYPPVEEIVGQCGKFQLLEKLLKKLDTRNHKVLIFSQWTKVLDIMHYYFSETGMEVCRIDGSVKLEDRRKQIQDFNDPDSEYKIFLLSTRAGGLGINLTSADTCILYDSDWNPQMDLQAMDRCHRIGQTKPVHVYRLATAQSVEGRILKRAFSKLRLEHVVIGKGQFQQERSKTDHEVLEEDDMLALLRGEEDEEDKMIQTDISDEDLERVLDRSDLIAAGPAKADGKPDFLVSTLPLKGPGWEVVIPTATGGMLSTVNN